MAPITAEVHAAPPSGSTYSPRIVKSKPRALEAPVPRRRYMAPGSAAAVIVLLRQSKIYVLVT